MKKVLLLVVIAAGLLSFFLLRAQSSTDENETATGPSGVGKWAPFGIYHVGDSVLYYAGKWKQGIIKELGVPYNPANKNASTNEAKYLVLQGSGNFNWPEWMDISQVAGLQRQEWWTGFFTGLWQVGEVMAVNTRTEGSYEHNEYSYHKATETLNVRPDGTYVWKYDGKTISGKWIALEEGPGIVLKKGYKGFDWTFINQTNAITMHIRKLENGRLFPNGTEMSKAANRSMK